jgi:hypothetical protein
MAEGVIEAGCADPLKAPGRHGPFRVQTLDSLHEGPVLQGIVAESAHETLHFDHEKDAIVEDGNIAIVMTPRSMPEDLPFSWGSAKITALLFFLSLVIETSGPVCPVNFFSYLDQIVKTNYVHAI